MSIFNRRNAVLGWATWSVLKRTLHRKAAAEAEAAKAAEEEAAASRWRRRRAAEPEPEPEPKKKRSKRRLIGSRHGDRGRRRRLAQHAAQGRRARRELGRAARPGRARREPTSPARARRREHGAALSSAPGATNAPPLGSTCPGGYAVIGEVDGPLGVFARAARRGARVERHRPDRRPARGGSRPQPVDAERPKPFRRKSRGTFVAALYALDEEPEDGLRQSYPMLVRALANVVLCYVPSTGVSFTTMERGHYTVGENGGGREFAQRCRRAPAPARDLAARDRERVPHRPRARALGRRRADARDRRGRPAPRRARPAAGAVPDRGAARRARPPPRPAPLRHRRALLRQPLGAQGRRALLDERERRRQGPARRAQPRHPARHRLRPGERAHDPHRRRRTSSRAASRSTRSSTG